MAKYVVYTKKLKELLVISGMVNLHQMTPIPVNER